MPEPDAAAEASRQRDAAVTIAGSAVTVVGFSLRKRRLLRRFLPDCRLRFVDRPERIRSGDTVAVWASSPLRPAVEARPDLTILRIEDGFLRSVGLGARLTEPLSWVVDGQGIHYDPSRPSALESLLQTAEFDAAEIARARTLRERIVAAGISKYNLGGEPSAAADRPPVRCLPARCLPVHPRPSRGPVVLVAGQVESDAALRAGAAGIATNVELIRAARRRHPDGWIVYKPHPDVVAGLRRAGRGEPLRADTGLPECDEIAADAPIAPLLDAVDVVHVMTSLTGFEALLRGKAVHCHGLPFYAGWGLTTDAAQSPRRTRRRSLDELVAAALIRYPRYASRVTGRPCSPEQALDELVAWARHDSGGPRWWHRLLEPVLRHA